MSIVLMSGADIEIRLRRERECGVRPCKEGEDCVVGKECKSP